MKIARFWVRESATAVDKDGREHLANAWGWSSDNREEASLRAKSAAERIAHWLVGRSAKEPVPSAQYQYFGGRPPREEIVKEFHDADGAAMATITRNLYGSLVLNCRDLMFVDIDCREPSPIHHWLRKLFGMTRPARRSAEAALEKIRNWCRANPHTSLRLYRTAAGLRAAIVDRPILADAAEARRILDELDSDPLYRRLCDAQQCFRARLSPKAWRINIDALRVRFPYDNAEDQTAAQEWVGRYDSAAAAYSTCRFLEWHGAQKTYSKFTPLLDLHDSLTRCDSGLPLA